MSSKFSIVALFMYHVISSLCIQVCVAERYTRYGGVRFESPVNSETVECSSKERCSLLHCATVCTSSKACVSFSYSKTLRQCILTSQYYIHGVTTDVTVDPQWSTYDQESRACDSQPCQNDGTCSDDVTGGYTCSCTGSFTGTNCEIEPSPCDSQPCQNSGTCSDDGSGGYTCSCVGGYTGTNCQTSGPRHCKDLLDSGQTTSGVYTVYPDSVTSFSVFCDQQTAGGGWVVFQRRQDGSETFDRAFAEYLTGFGDLQGEFWLGLEKIDAFTSRWTQEMRVDVGASPSNHGYETYSNFRFGSSYSLQYDSASGSAGDCVANQKGRAFSTPPSNPDSVCSSLYYGAWWLNNCYYCNLNGRYGATNGGGVKWHTYGGDPYRSHDFSEMKIRPQ